MKYRNPCDDVIYTAYCTVHNLHNEPSPTYKKYSFQKGNSVYNILKHKEKKDIVLAYKIFCLSLECLRVQASKRFLVV